MLCVAKDAAEDSLVIWYGFARFIILQAAVVSPIGLQRPRVEFSLGHFPDIASHRACQSHLSDALSLIAAGLKFD